MTQSQKTEKTNEMLKINTTRFGELEIEEKRLIHFPEGILGFPEEKYFVILEHKPNSPFCWLQSAQSPELAFVIMNPFLVKQDYLMDLPAPDKAIFEGEEAKNLVIFSIVTIPKGNAEKMTINLLGPIIIDTNKRIGRQLVLAGTGYSPRHPIIT